MKKLSFKSRWLFRSLTVAVLVMGGTTAQAGPLPQVNGGTEQTVPTVTGRVLDENGEPLIGAAVIVKGTNVGTATDFDGRYSIKAPQGSTLIVRSVGYHTLEVRVNGNQLTIVAQEDTQVLNEVVVTALGIKKEAKSLSYNVQQVTGDALMRVQDANFVNSLSGKVAGVTINTSATGAGGSSRVVMRGAKSINGNNNVLYVVDGIPMQNLSSEQPEGIFAGAGQTGDATSNINPDDIESISALTAVSSSPSLLSCRVSRTSTGRARRAVTSVGARNWPRPAITAPPTSSRRALTLLTL